MLASLAGARQYASFATNALTGKSIEMAAIQTSALDQRCKDLKAMLSLRLLDQVAGAPREIAANMVVYRLSCGHDGRRYLQFGKNFFDHAFGSVNMNVLPFPISLSTQMRPLWASTIPLAMARPSPIRPDSLVRELPLPVKNFSKIFD